MGSPDDRDWPAELVRENIQAFGNHKYFQRLKDLRAKSVFVCTMWFDGKGYWEKALADSQRRPVPVVITTGFDNISVLINRSLRFTGVDGRQWSWSNEYVDKNVTVLETHMPSAESMASLTNKEIAALCYQDVKQLVPGLPEPKGSYVNRWDTYLNCEVGEEARRPTIQLPIDSDQGARGRKLGLPAWTGDRVVERAAPSELTCRSARAQGLL